MKTIWNTTVPVHILLNHFTLEQRLVLYVTNWSDISFFLLGKAMILWQNKYIFVIVNSDA